jgi:hypothetical protein
MPKPSELPAAFDADKARRALMKHHGSILKAARALKIPAPQLRAAVRRDPTLIAAALEAFERNLDRAEEIICEGLTSEDFRTRLACAGHLLRFSPAARRRGYG